VASALGLIVHRFIRIHLLNLLDGSPYSAPSSNAIVWGLPQRVSNVSIQDLVITSSRVMMRIFCWEVVREDDIRVGRIFVWDWKTGDLVRLSRHEYFSSHVLLASHPTSSDTQPPIYKPELSV